MSQFVINERSYSSVLPLDEELSFNENKNYLFYLDCLSVITVEGARAGEFLQGQLTCDINLVSNHTMQQGAYCNLKGRVQILVDVINWDGFKLILPKDLIEDTLASLAKTALLSRVKIAANNSYHLYGLSLSDSSNSIPFMLPKEKEVCVNEFGACYGLDKHRYIVVTTDENFTNFYEKFSQTNELRGSLGWHRLQLDNLIPEIYPNTQGKFLPHRIELPKKGYINFNKGCYKGQEIIARTHYRATIKHRFRKFILTTDISLSAGDIFFNVSGQEVGEIIDLCPLRDNQFLILASLLQDCPSEVFVINQDKTTALLLCF